MAHYLESRPVKLKPLSQREAPSSDAATFELPANICLVAQASQDASRAKEYRAAAFCMHSRGGKVNTPASG